MSYYHRVNPKAKDEAKAYVASRQIPQLFEALTAGLLYHRPADPTQFVQDGLASIRDKKGDVITWKTFVEWKPPERCMSAPVTSTGSLPRPRTSGSGKSKLPSRGKSAGSALQKDSSDDSGRIQTDRQNMDCKECEDTVETSDQSVDTDGLNISEAVLPTH